MKDHMLHGAKRLIDATTQPHIPQAVGAADHQGLLGLRLNGDGVTRLVPDGENGFGMHQQALSCRRELDVVAGPGEKRDPKHLFQLPDSGTDRGLADVEIVRRPAKVACAVNLEKGFEITDIHSGSGTLHLCGKMQAMHELDDPSIPAAQREVYTVSRLNLEARGVLERGFPLLWVEGEISNLARPRSGHLYFTLKDAYAQIRCAMFRNRQLQSPVKITDGMLVTVRARATLYEARGEFQLVVEHAEEAGVGELQRRFERLKQQLAAEGLFDAAHKKPFPPVPRCLGVITSPSGAAIRDILQVLKRRHAGLPIVIYPTAVQGERAPAEIVAALRRADAEDRCDVLLVARGGGSLEDLWAFNDEQVVRTLFGLRKPVVSAIGHEIDFTLTDFVADLRAPTPSAAAELLSPDTTALERRLAELASRLARREQALIQSRLTRLDQLQARLGRQAPRRRLQAMAQRVDESEQRLVRSLQRRLETHALAVQRAARAVRRNPPQEHIRHLAQQLHHLRGRLSQAYQRRLEQSRSRLAVTVRTLDAVGPLATLSRGYAIVTDRDQRIIRSSESVAIGDAITARVAHGELECRVERKR